MATCVQTVRDVAVDAQQRLYTAAASAKDRTDAFVAERVTPAVEYVKEHSRPAAMKQVATDVYEGNVAPHIARAAVLAQDTAATALEAAKKTTDAVIAHTAQHSAKIYTFAVKCVATVLLLLLAVVAFAVQLFNKHAPVAALNAAERCIGDAKSLYNQVGAKPVAEVISVCRRLDEKYAAGHGAQFVHDVIEVALPAPKQE